jgi:hypothetical protein
MISFVVIILTLPIIGTFEDGVLKITSVTLSSRPMVRFSSEIDCRDYLKINPPNHNEIARCVEISR